eukprot:3244613-Prorocentrum_lima.AAC.1
MDKEAQGARQSWLSWLESSLLGGASKLHRATKGPQQEGHVEEDGCAWVGQQAMQILADRWGSLWTTHKAATLDPCKGPTIQQEQVEEAIKTFSLRSGLGLDSTNPRWWQWLPPDMVA